MQEALPQIENEWREGFRQALGAYINWFNDRTRPLSVTVDRKLVPVESVCDVVEKRQGTMPKDVYDLLSMCAAESGQALPEDHSYSGGARCLRSLVNYQRRLDDLKAKASKER